MTTALERMGRAELLARVADLEASNDVLAKNHAIMLENLTATQTRCSELLDRLRGCRAIWMTEGYGDALDEIAAAAYRAVCKHGQFAPRLTHIPDGTGGEHLTTIRDALQRECSEAEANGTLSWGLLASEEFFEAMAEQDPIKLRTEVAQLGAVCGAWLEALDKRGAA